jgi:hypothetical protein
MAATAQVVKRGASGDLFERLVDVTLDGNYPAGGYPLTPQQLGFGLNGRVMFADAPASTTGGWEAGWDYTNGKLQVFDSSGAASAAMHEVAPATVLTGVVVRMLVKGIGQG